MTRAMMLSGLSPRRRCERSTPALLGCLLSHGVADESTFSGVDAQLLKWLSAEPIGRGPADFEKRLLSTDPDTHPLVTIGGRLQAVNAGAFGLTREIAVLAALRDHVGLQAQGRAYEAALVDLFKAVGPPDLTASSDRRIGPPGTTGKKGHEVDLLISGEDLLVVGEAKAYIPARHGPGVSSSYEDQLLKSIRQIEVRLAALAQGRWCLGNPPTPVDVSHRIGLCVPLHDYGGTAWRGDALARFFTSNPCVVMPVHGFALAMSCLRNAGEVSGYLRMRLALSNGLMAGQDELEPLLGWIHGGYFKRKSHRRRNLAADTVPTFVLAPLRARPAALPSHRNHRTRTSGSSRCTQGLLPSTCWMGATSLLMPEKCCAVSASTSSIGSRTEATISLGRGARRQVWPQLLSFPPFRSEP